MIRPQIQEPSAHARRILVVDDHRDGAEALGLLLQMEGHEVQLAHDGVEAVEIARAFQPDAVLMDIRMPEVDGYEACRRIRAEPWGGNVVMIAQTGWSEERDRERASLAGFDGHLTKPVDMAAFTEILGSLLDGGGGAPVSRRRARPGSKGARRG